MIDILLSTYNGEKYIKELLNSLDNQTCTDWTLIVRDDCSTDETVNIINEFGKKYPGKIIIVDNENQNLGSAKSFLSLLQYSNGDLIFFCDQDDVWKNKKLEEYKKFYDKIDDATERPILVFSDLTVVNSDLEVQEYATKAFNRNKGKNNTNIKWNILQNDVTGCAMMINKNLKDLCLSGLNDLFVIHHDWFLSLIATAVNGKYYFPYEAIYYRQHENNVVGARKISFIKTLIDLVNHKRRYPYYRQAKSLLSLNIEFKNEEIHSQIKSFSELQEKNKFYRVFWHIKNRFLRSGSFINRVYQLYIC